MFKRLIPLLFIFGLAQARDAIEIDANISKPLGPDEGFLLLQVKSNSYFSRITLKREGKAFLAHNMKKVPEGVTSVLLRVKAGEYYWNNMEYDLGFGSGFIFDLGKERFGFEVKPGVINYPGQLNVVVIGRSYTAQMINNAIDAMQQLQAQTPQLTNAVPFEMNASENDEFAKHLAQLSQVGDPSKVMLDLDFSGEADAETYLRPRELMQVVLNPFNKLMILLKLNDGLEAVEVLDPDTLTAHRIIAEDKRVNTRVIGMHWIDADTLILEMQRERNKKIHLMVVHFDLSGETLQLKSHYFLHKEALVEAPLVDIENKAYFRFQGSQSSQQLYLVDLSTQTSAEESLIAANRAVPEVPNQRLWLVDKDARVSMVLSHDEDAGAWNYHVREDGQWKIKYSDTADDLLSPIGWHHDGRLLMLHRPKGQEFRGIYTFDLATGGPPEPLMVATDHGVETHEFDARTGRILSYGYHRSGRYIEQASDPQLQKILKQLDEKYADFDAVFLGVNADHSHWLFYLQHFANRGYFVTYDSKQQAVQLVLDTAPWVRDLPKAELHYFKQTVEAGYTLDAFLVHPTVPVKALYVNPHGGPIGVRDTIDYDGEALYLASQGIATLRVNYRGSGGYGRTFQSAGAGQWGAAIEKDINDVVSQVLQKYPDIPASAVCAGGASYGGYSALMLGIIYPGRYHCLVSMAGPLDLPLWFSDSDWSNNADSVANMKRIVGDPDTELERMQSISPVYRAADVLAPVLLFHGLKDPRVTAEHSKRMSMVLTRLGKPHAFKSFPEEGHGFDNLNNENTYISTVARFILQSLSESAAPSDGG